MGMRGINATPKRASTRAHHAHDLPPHPWEKPGLSRAERVIRFVEFAALHGWPIGRHDTKAPAVAKTLHPSRLQDRQGRQPAGENRGSVCGQKKREDTAGRRFVPVPFVRPRGREPRGECYSVACTRFQAGRVFNEMVAIITRTPWLNDRINIVRFRKELEDLINGSTFDVLSADVAPVHGLSPSFICYDELAQVPTRALYDALGTALGGRAQPLMLVITTQAARDEAPMSELVDYGLRIARGEIADPGFHLTFYTAPPEADPWKLATWKLANPALGDFRSLEDVQAPGIASATHAGRRSELPQSNLKSARRRDRAIHDMRAWKACGDDGIDDSGLKGRPCFAGLDLGATRDMTALVLVFAGDDGDFDRRCRFAGCRARRCRSAWTKIKCRMRCGRSKATC